MTDPRTPEELDNGPVSEPPTLITTASPAQAEDPDAPKSAMPSPLGDGPVPSRAASDAHGPESAMPKKARPKMTLRIPDDEVARPSRPVPTPGAPPSVAARGLPHVAPPPASVAPSVRGDRIVSLSIDTPTKQIEVPASRPPPAPAGGVAAPLSSMPVRPPSIVLPSTGEDTAPRGLSPAQLAARRPADPEPEDSWTPFQPMVADQEPPDSGQGIDIVIDTGEPESEPAAPPKHDVARTIPGVAPAPRPSGSFAHVLPPVTAPAPRPTPPASAAVSPPLRAVVAAPLPPVAVASAHVSPPPSVASAHVSPPPSVASAHAHSAPSAVPHGPPPAAAAHAPPPPSVAAHAPPGAASAPSAAAQAPPPPSIAGTAPAAVPAAVQGPAPSVARPLVSPVPAPVAPVADGVTPAPLPGISKAPSSAATADSRSPAVSIPDADPFFQELVLDPLDGSSPPSPAAAPVAEAAPPEDRVTAVRLPDEAPVAVASAPAVTASASPSPPAAAPTDLASLPASPLPSAAAPAAPAPSPVAPSPAASSPAPAASSAAPSPAAPAPISVGRTKRAAGLAPRGPNEAGLEEDEISVDLEPAVSSEPQEPAEISPEDVVSVEAVSRAADVAPASVPPPPPMRPRASSVPSFASASVSPVPVPIKPARGSGPSLSTATVKTSVAPEHVSTPPKPRVIVPVASPLAPHPMGDAVSSSRRKVRPWWEELFNDDFIRTMMKISDAQISTEVDFIEESLGLDKGAMVLDLACGTGRHAIELTRRGYQVVGFDLSLAMLAKAADEAQDRNQRINFVQGDMREMTFDGTFDGVYCWNTSFGFFEEEKNITIIENVRRALKPGGMVLLDVINRDFVAQGCPSLVWFEGDGCVCMDDMSIDWITSRMKVKRTMMMDDGRSREIEYSVRIYSLHELGKILHDLAFKVTQVSGLVATPGVFFGANSPRALILAEKR